MKFSLSTFVYFRYSLDEAIKRTKKAGYDGVEIWGGRPHAYWEDMPDNRIKEIRKLLNDIDLKISNFIPAQFRYPTNLASSNKLIREGSVDYIKHNIEVAEKLESPYVSLCPGFSLYDDGLKNAYNSMMKSFDEIIDFSKNYKTKLIIEPAHAMETDLVLTTEDGIDIVEHFGNDKIGLCLDTGHLNVNKENLSDVVKKVKKYDVHWHIDDNFGENDEHLIPGEGNINFEIFLEKLKESEYNGFLAVELGFGYTNDPNPSVRKSLEFLNKNI